MTQRFGWTGRDDPGDGTMTKRWHHVVRRFTEDFDHDDCIGGIVGFACDLGVERNQGRLWGPAWDPMPSGRNWPAWPGTAARAP